MAGKGPLNYTSAVPASRTASECVELLGRAGADQVALTYGKDRYPMAVSFVVTMPWGQRQYLMTADPGGTLAALQRAWRAGRIPERHATMDQARRTCWRTLQDLLEVQLAAIENGSAQFAQVMLPYMQDDSGRTAWEAFRDAQLKALEASDAG